MAANRTGLNRTPSGLWRARYRDAAGHQHAKTFATVSEAQQWRRGQLAAVDRGTHVDPGAGRVTFREYAEAWRARQVHRPSTQAHTETMLRRHAYPTLGDRPLSAILPSEVQAWVKRLTGQLSPSTVGVVHGIVSGIFRDAIRDRTVAANPCQGTRLPPKERHQVEPLATETVEALAAALPPRYRALVLLAAGTGLRHGEAVGLTLDRADFLRRSLRVDRQLSTVSGRTPFLSPPKTRASARTIPLPQVVLDALAQHLAAFPATELDVPTHDGRTTRAALLFTNDAGRPIRRTSWGDTWRAAVREAGAPAGTGFHDLRHYFASLLIRHGESVKVVQARLGHASAVETLDTYSHLWPDSDDRTREAVDAVLGSCVLSCVLSTVPDGKTAGQRPSGERAGL